VAFGIWARGHISDKPIDECLEEFSRCTEDQFILVPSPYKLANGDMGFKVLYREIKDYLSPGFFFATRYWNDYRKYSEKGMYPKDFRTLTTIQKTVLDTFDKCFDLYLEEVKGKDGRARKAQAEADKIRGFSG
jgi:hypothetical protein